MKYLKRLHDFYLLESKKIDTFNQDDFDSILDAFQDIIDDYDIEPSNDEDDDAVSYSILYVAPNDKKYCPEVKNFEPINFINDEIYYKTGAINKNLGPINFKIKSIIIQIHLPLTVNNKKIFKYEKESEIIKDVENFNNRLNLMGYRSTINPQEYGRIWTTEPDVCDYIQYIDIIIPTSF